MAFASGVGVAGGVGVLIYSTTQVIFVKRPQYHYMDEEEEYDMLHAVRDIMSTSRSFHQTIRYLNNDTRNQLVALHERNTNLALALLRTWIMQEQRQTVVMNIPIDANGTFMDAVPIIPTQAQILAACEIRTTPHEDTSCTICQEDIQAVNTRIRYCGHSFHSNCIREWFGMNPRCPVCRYDIRDFQPTNALNSNDRSMHTDG